MEKRIIARNDYYDILRAIGLLSIVLVHCGIPRMLYQLNLWNVTLMVFISGIVSVSSSSIEKSYFSYVWSRTLRLIIPTWIFISCYLTFLYLLTELHLIDFFLFNPKSIISSYLLLDSSFGGIGFVWIIRVFLLTTLATPIIYKFNKKIEGWHHYLVIMLLLMGTQFVFCDYSSLVSLSPLFFGQFLVYLLGYSIVTMGG